MVDIHRCSKCESIPYLMGYIQSTDGNHDKRAYIKCPTCGNSFYMGWEEYKKAGQKVGDRKYAGNTAYLSQEFINVLNDETIMEWNRRN